MANTYSNLKVHLAVFEWMVSVCFLYGNHMAIPEGNYTIAHCFANALFACFLFNDELPFLGENVTGAVLLIRHSRICGHLKVR